MVPHVSLDTEISRSATNEPSLIILAYQPTIIYSDLPSLESGDHAPASKEISASSAKSILDIVVFAELVCSIMYGQDGS